MSFHQYKLNELYSNADGSIQFIEMVVGNFNGESFSQGNVITSTQGGTTRSFTFPSNLPSTATANTSILLATQGFADLGLVTPNFIIPAQFLFTNGGTVNFSFGASAITYASLPTDGLLSLSAGNTTATNSPRNFAGATASVVPPPTDTTAPTVVSFSPVDEATGIGIASNIVVTFSEAIARGAGSIVLKNAAGTAIESFAAASSSRLGVSGSTLTIDPTADLSNNTSYKVEFGSGTVKDLAGNGYAGTTDYNFTTLLIANNPPTASTSGNRFAALNQSVSLNLGALFVDMDGDVLSFGATGVPAGLSINATSGLISGTTPNATGDHQITVTGTDPGNALASLSFHLNIVAGNTVLNNVTTRGGIALPGVIGHEFQSNANLVTTLSRGTADFLINGTTKPVSAADALDALKLSVGLNASQGTSWKELIAADITRDGRVTAADALEILKTSVGINTVQPSWVFVPTDAAFNPNLTTMSRIAVSYEDKINFAFAASTSTSVTGILVGDVNNSWVIPA